MREISYQMFDKMSDALILTFTDDKIRKIASKTGKSCSLIFKESERHIVNAGLNYIILNDKVFAISKKDPEKYNVEKFDDYSSANSFLYQDLSYRD